MIDLLKKHTIHKKKKCKDFEELLFEYFFDCNKLSYLDQKIYC